MSINASSKKKQDKDLQEHVQNSFSTIIHDFFMTNIKQIGIAALIVVVLVVAGLGWNSYKQSQNEKALVLEAEAFELYNKSQETPAANETTETSVAPEKSLQDVLAVYQKLIDLYPGAESAERAIFSIGSLQYTHRNYEEAQQQFETYVAKYPKGQFAIQAQENLAYIFEQQGDYQKAIDQLLRIEESAASSRKALVTLAIGRNYETLGQTDKAIETYERILDSNTSGTWKDMAKERLALLQPEVATPAEEPEAATQEVEDNS